MKKDSDKFTVKDLVNAGLFSLLCMVAIFIGGMTGFIPVFMPLVPFFGGLLSGIVFMVYCSKVQKRGMLFILAVVVILAFTATGHGFYIAIPGVILALVGEWIMSKKGYKDLNMNRLAYSIFILCLGGNLYPVYFLRDEWMKNSIALGYQPEFIETITKVLPNWSFIPVTLLAGVGAFIGCSIGMKLLEKHFKKAGMM